MFKFSKRTFLESEKSFKEFPQKSSESPAKQFYKLISINHSEYHSVFSKLYPTTENNLSSSGCFLKVLPRFISEKWLEFFQRQLSLAKTQTNLGFSWASNGFQELINDILVFGVIKLVSLAFQCVSFKS